MVPTNPRPSGMLMNSTDTSTTVQQLKNTMRDFVDERNWQRFHNAKNLSMSISIEAAELMEHFQWLTTEEVVRGQGYDLSEVEDELADVACYVISLANALNVDLSSAIARKMVKNRLKYPAPPADSESHE